MDLFSLQTAQHAKHRHKLDNNAWLPIIRDPARIFLERAYNPLYTNIQKISMCPTLHWQNTYGSLLEQLSLLLQELPAKEREYQARGGLLLRALDRALAVLVFFRRSHQTWHGSLSPKQLALWEFALISATLCADLGELACEYQVEWQAEKLESTAQRWSIHQGALPQLPHAQRYRVRDAVPSVPARLRYSLTPPMATHMMPAHLMCWLASDPEVLYAWLRWLAREPSDLAGQAHSFWAQNLALQQALLSEAEWMRLLAQYHLHEYPVKKTTDEPLTQPEAAAPGTSQPPSSSSPLRQQQVQGAEHWGLAFLTWMQESLRSGYFTEHHHQGIVHVTDEGVALLFPAIFQEFCRARAQHVNWELVHRQFMALGIARMNADHTQLHIDHLRYLTEFSEPLVRENKLDAHAAATIYPSPLPHDAPQQGPTPPKPGYVL